MTVDFNYPYNIAPNKPAVAAEVQSNFDQLLSWIKVNYRQIDDTPRLTEMPVLPGTPTQADHAATKAYVDAVIPIGTIVPYGGDVAALPDRFIACDGSAHSTTGQYAALFAVIGYRFGGSGGTFNVPDLGGRVVVGRSTAAGDFDTVGKTGGVANQKQLAHQHTQAGHNHAVGLGPAGDHGHNVSVYGEAWTNGGGAHNHNIGTSQLLYKATFSGVGIVGVGDPANYGYANSGVYGSHDGHQHYFGVSSSGSTSTNSGDHNHTVSQSTVAPTINSTGVASTANDNYPLYQVAAYMIRV